MQWFKGPLPRTAQVVRLCRYYHAGSGDQRLKALVRRAGAALEEEPNSTTVDDLLTNAEEAKYLSSLNTNAVNQMIALSRSDEQLERVVRFFDPKSSFTSKIAPYALSGIIALRIGHGGHGSAKNAVRMIVDKYGIKDLTASFTDLLIYTARRRDSRSFRIVLEEIVTRNGLTRSSLFAKIVDKNTPMSIITVLVEYGCFPQNDTHYELISQRMARERKRERTGDQIITNFAKAVACNMEHGRKVPQKMLLFVFMKSAGLTSHEMSRDAVVRLIQTCVDKGYKASLTAQVVSMVIRSHRYISVGRWEDILSHCGVTVSPATKRQGLLMRRMTTRAFLKNRNGIKKILTMLNEIKSGDKDLVPIDFYTQVLRLVCHQAVKLAPELYTQMTAALPSHVQEIDRAYLSGLFHSKHYLRVIKHHYYMIREGRDNPRSWNYCLSAAAKSLRIETVNHCIEEMIARRVFIQKKQVADAVISYLEIGRLPMGHKHDRKSRPPGFASSKKTTGTLAQHQPMPIEDIVKFIDLLSSNGYCIDEAYWRWFYDQIELFQLSYDEFERLTLALARSVCQSSSSSSPSSSSSSTSKPSLSNDTVDRLIRWGYRKSPARPWRVLELINKMEQTGITFSDAEVRSAFSRYVGLVYGFESVQGEFKRVRMQSSEDMDAVIDKINKVWSSIRKS